MKTYFEILKEAFDSHRNYSDWMNKLLSHDLTAEVVVALDGVPQGTFYHPEFDALIHTYYVCRAALESGRVDLLEVAFLHDWGKADMTNIGKDRIYHFGHPEKSYELVSNRLDYLKGDTFWTTDLILKHMGSKNSSADLDAFMYCDKVLSKEIFLREATEDLIIENREKEKAVYARQENSDTSIIMLVGISGSGKSRYIKEMGYENIVVCPDNIREEVNGNISSQGNSDLVWEKTKNRLHWKLNTEGKAVLDATNVGKFLRVKFMSGFNYHRKVAVVFNVDLEIAISRVRADIEAGRNRSNVPENVIKRQYKNFQRGLASLEHEFNEVIHIDANG